jgi:uncharacterized protein
MAWDIGYDPASNAVVVTPEQLLAKQKIHRGGVCPLGGECMLRVIRCGFGKRSMAFAALLLAACAPAAKALAADIAEQAANVAGLRGTLLRPAASGARPAVLIVGAAGPLDRDGNNPPGVSTNAYKMLAEALAGAGISSLRYDKRGVGASAGAATAGAELSVNDYAADVAAMANWLAAQPNISRVIIAGHSDGALQALMAADLVKVSGFALLSAPGREPGIGLREQLARQPLSETDREAGVSIMNALESDIDIGLVPANLQEMFRPSKQPLLRSILRLDPQMLLVNRREPVLIVGGGADTQVSKADFDALVVARRDAITLWSGTMTHTLKNADPADPRQLNIAVDATRPLAADTVAALIAFARR